MKKRTNAAIFTVAVAAGFGASEAYNGLTAAAVDYKHDFGIQFSVEANACINQVIVPELCSRVNAQKGFEGKDACDPKDIDHALLKPAADGSWVADALASRKGAPQ